jgi:hypothetical protein
METLITPDLIVTCPIHVLKHHTLPPKYVQLLHAIQTKNPTENNKQ